MLAGLSSTADSVEEETVGSGRLCASSACTPPSTTGRTSAGAPCGPLRTNLSLVWRLRREIAAADELLFTGSPPFLIHFLVPANLLFRRRLTYRITDFHPECLMAELGRIPWPLAALPPPHRGAAPAHPPLRGPRRGPAATAAGDRHRAGAHRPQARSVAGGDPRRHAAPRSAGGAARLPHPPLFRELRCRPRS